MQRKTRIILFPVLGVALLAALIGGIALSRQLRQKDKEKDVPPENVTCVFGDTEREHFLIYFRSSIHENTLTGNETPVESLMEKVAYAPPPRNASKTMA